MTQNIDIKKVKPLAWFNSGFVFVTCSVLTSISWILPRIDLLTSSIAEQLEMAGPIAIEFERFFVLLFCTFIISLLGVRRGNVVAKKILICTLFLMTIAVLDENLGFIRYELAISRENGITRWGEWWYLTEGVRWILWSGFNYWYLFARGRDPH